MIVPFPQAPEKSRRVRALTGTLTRLTIALRTARAEPEVERLTDEIEAVTTCLARAEASEIDEVRGKAVVLRTRLEEILDPEVPGEATTLALVASIIMDLDQVHG